MKNLPYTYLIYCKSTKQYYYGVRYSKNCNPTDLWKSYFTSSKYVRNLINKYGKDDFLFEIRKTFINSYKARCWEQKVLTRMNASKRKDFINKNNSGFPNGQNRIWITNGKQNKFIDILEIDNYTDWKKGRTFSKTTKQKISKTRQSQNIINKPNHTREQKIKWSKMRKGKINGRDTSKPVIINNKKYISIKQAMKETGLSRYIIKQLNP